MNALTPKLLDDVFLETAESSSVDLLGRHLAAFAARHDFEFSNLIFVEDGPAGVDTKFTSVVHLPDGYIDHYYDLDAGKQDPVMKHVKHRSTPTVWSREVYQAADMDEYWDCMEAYGLGNGVALAVHLPHGQHLALGLFKRTPLSGSSTHLTQVLAEAHLFCAHAIGPALELLGSRPADRAPAPALSKREVEVLEWTLGGKTAWEIGRILAIAERTAVKHLQSAYTKLGCTNKHQAVVKAVRLGLIR